MGWGERRPQNASQPTLSASAQNPSAWKTELKADSRFPRRRYSKPLSFESQFDSKAFGLRGFNDSAPFWPSGHGWLAKERTHCGGVQVSPEEGSRRKDAREVENVFFLGSRVERARWPCWPRSSRPAARRRALCLAASQFQQAPGRVECERLQGHGRISKYAVRRKWEGNGCRLRSSRPSSLHSSLLRRFRSRGTLEGDLR